MSRMILTLQSLTNLHSSTAAFRIPVEEDEILWLREGTCRQPSYDYCRDSNLAYLWFRRASEFPQGSTASHIQCPAQGYFAGGRKVIIPVKDYPSASKFFNWISIHHIRDADRVCHWPSYDEILERGTHVDPVPDILTLLHDNCYRR